MPLSDLQKQIAGHENMLQILARVQPILDQNGCSFLYVNTHEYYFWVTAEKETDVAEYMANAARAIRRAIPGSTSDKKGNYYSFFVSVRIPESAFYFRFYANRDTVCKKVETGKMIVIEETDYKAPKIKREVPEIVWECSPILDKD